MKLNNPIIGDIGEFCEYPRFYDDNNSTYIKFCRNLYVSLDIELFNILTDEIRQPYNIGIS